MIQRRPTWWAEDGRATVALPLNDGVLGGNDIKTIGCTNYTTPQEIESLWVVTVATTYILTKCKSVYVE